MENELEKDRVVSSHELQEEFKNLPPQMSFPTGWESFDAMTVGGLHEGQVIVLTGLTGEGKTQACVSMIKHMSDMGTKSIFFCYEETAQEIFKRFNGDVPLFYLPRLKSSAAPEWIEKKIKEAVDNFGVKVVFIDHLHYMLDMATVRNKNTSEMIGQLMRSFNNIAEKHRVAVVVLCHVRKLTRKEGRPTKADLKDSSEIGNIADVVAILHRIKDRSGKVEDEDGAAILANEAWLYLDKVRMFGGQEGRIRMTLDENRLYVEA